MQRKHKGEDGLHDGGILVLVTGDDDDLPLVEDANKYLNKKGWLNNVKNISEVEVLQLEALLTKIVIEL